MPLQTSAAARLASTLASLRELGVTDRSTHLRVLRETLDHHPHHIAVWAVWDADALDGNDRAFAGTSAHDAQGRFTPLWHRCGSKPALLAMELGPLLSCLKGSAFRRKPTVLAPYQRSFEGAPALLATITAPIMLGQRCVGIAGMDFALDSLAAQLVSDESREDAVAQLHEMGAELTTGVVCLDGALRVIAFSRNTSEVLGSFTAQPVEVGQPLPAELRPVERDPSGNMAPVIMERRGITLTGSWSRPQPGGASVLVLAANATELSLPPLSMREDEVMQWLSEGKSNEEIGIILSISHHTVKNHLDRIYRKIGVDNRHAAMLAWSRAKALTGTVSCP